MATFFATHARTPCAMRASTSSAASRSGLSAKKAVAPRALKASAPARVAMGRAALRVCAIEVSGPGANNGGGGNTITHPLIVSMQTKIKEDLEADFCEVVDVNGDQQHVSIEVISSFFEGKNSVQRQRAVYKAIWEELQEQVHAVDAMVCKTPEEAGK